ncbi:MAG: SHOCT domain-containing protein [Desulfomonilia bacterium]|uniref:SHOCT domain-containing protein n=1 Tax=anaerobic digester metagenome TaxID=1263854 RepID=A0A485LTJ1_9ZZZZ|nr:SHOCT domain-containing protein [Pseudomonadota bacterium]HPD20449.1 SHOCT domain-containing protein [Deltaproteobacteria bacterium]HPX18866.1 SHOCT domain-containing protein [Deltaproteobacteria bacterium]HRS55380.1 SHOCT domain-containing protein [Desulfomonilia bacterium]HRV34589.1 SHOCT domain-containing protein [Desulfomonilia bacterium]
MKNTYRCTSVWLASLFTLAFSTVVMAQGYYDRHGWGMMNSWFGGAIMWIIIFLLILLVVYLFIRVTRGPSASYEAGRETPLDIVEKRYARGEISKAQFEEMKKDLSS